MTSNIHTQIDPRGDLTLAVGEEDKTHFLVCSRVMARASLVFKAMFFGKFMEASPSGFSTSWTVALLGDDPKIFEIVHLIHAQFSSVPTSTHRELFCNLYILADKYLMTYILLPYATCWYTNSPDYENNWYFSFQTIHPRSGRLHGSR